MSSILNDKEKAKAIKEIEAIPRFLIMFNALNDKIDGLEKRLAKLEFSKKWR